MKEIKYEGEKMGIELSMWGETPTCRDSVFSLIKLFEKENSILVKKEKDEKERQKQEAAR